MPTQDELGGGVSTETASIGDDIVSQNIVEYAGFWRRFVAWVIDIIISSIITIIITSPVACTIALVLLAFTEPSSVAPEGLEFIMDLGFMVEEFAGIVLTWLYYALMESSSKQATLGKMALGIVVTDLQGDRITFGRATGRHFAKILSWPMTLGIGFIMTGFTPRKQALHDIVANCLVVVKKPRQKYILSSGEPPRS